MSSSADSARSEREHVDDCATHWDLAAECTCTQNKRQLTDEQCEQIAAWARERRRSTGEMASIVVDHACEPGEPQCLHNSMTLYVHPEDYLALNSWAERQEPWRWPLSG